MKNNFIFLFMAVGVFMLSCEEPLKDIYDELDESGDSDLVLDFNYTLLDSDYELFEDAETSDSLVAETGFFEDLDQAKRLIPEVLAAEYPYLGSGSTAKVTFEVNEGLEELSSYINTSVLDVENEELASVDESASAAGFLSPSYEVEESLVKVLNAEFQSPIDGDIMAVDYGYASKDPIIDFTAAGLKTAHNEKFTGNIDGYTAISILGDQTWEYNQYFDENAAMAAYDGSGPTPNEDWLVSPAINLTEYTDSELRFLQVINYLGDGFAPSDLLFVKISTDFSGDVSAATWTELTVDAWPAGNSWSEEVWSTIDISAFDGEEVYIAFEYNNTVNLDDPTWEITEVIVEATASVSVTVVEEPLTLRDYYIYSGDWEKIDGLYHLTSDDLDAMGEASGQPGRYDNFSGSINPDDYLPTFLEGKFPFAIEGDEIILTYAFYNGSTVVRGDIYTYGDGIWSSTDVTLSFGFDGAMWVPDNTIKYTLGSDDWTFISEQWADRNAAGAESAGQYGNFDTQLWSETQRFEAITERLKVLFSETEDGQKYLITYDTWEPGNGTRELYVILSEGEYILFEE